MNFLFFAILHFFAVLSPGPTLIGMVTFALNNGFKKTLPFLLGIGIGNLIFSTISVFGLSELIFKVNFVEIGFYFFSGGFLMFFGYKIFFQKPLKLGVKINPAKSFFVGFGIEISNPKSILFTTSLVAIVITPESSMLMKLFTIFWLVFISLIYEFCIIYGCLKFQNKILNNIGIFNKVFGILLIVFGVKLALSGYSSLLEIYDIF